MKKIISMILVVALTLSYITPAFATDEVNKFGASTQEIYQQAETFAEARGIKILPYNEAMAGNNALASDQKNTVSVETSYDYEGKYELGEGKESDLSKPNHDSIDDQIVIQGGSSQDNAQTISVPSTTYDSIPSAGAVDWFTFRVTSNGQHNVYSTGSTDVKVEFYKKTWYGSYDLIDTNDDGGEGLNFRLELGLNTGVDYYVKVSGYSSQTGSYYLRVEGNRDSLYSPTGGSWTWDIASPDPDGIYFNIDKLVYLTPSEAQAYYIMVSRDDFRSVRDTILSLTFDAAVAYVIGIYKIKWAVAEFIVSEAAGFGFPDLTSLELDSIASAGGVNSSGEFTRGIKIVSLTTYTMAGTVMIPVMLNTYESWSSSYMYGQEYYRGSFSTTDKTPLWR